MQSLSREAGAATIVLIGDLVILKEREVGQIFLDHLPKGEADVMASETKRIREYYLGNVVSCCVRYIVQITSRVRIDIINCGRDYAIF